jgi:hypothetical protein
MLSVDWRACLDRLESRSNRYGGAWWREQAGVYSADCIGMEVFTSAHKGGIWSDSGISWRRVCSLRYNPESWQNGDEV